MAKATEELRREVKEVGGVSGGRSFCERLGTLPSVSNCEKRGRPGALERSRGHAFLHERARERRGEERKVVSWGGNEDSSWHLLATC